jgi:hypothetical protein
MEPQGNDNIKMELQGNDNNMEDEDHRLGPFEQQAR